MASPETSWLNLVVAVVALALMSGAFMLIATALRAVGVTSVSFGTVVTLLVGLVVVAVAVGPLHRHL